MSTIYRFLKAIARKHDNKLVTRFTTTLGLLLIVGRYTVQVRFKWPKDGIKGYGAAIKIFLSCIVWSLLSASSVFCEYSPTLNSFKQVSSLLFGTFLRDDLLHEAQVYSGPVFRFSSNPEKIVFSIIQVLRIFGV